MLRRRTAPTIGYSDFGSEVDIQIPEASAALSSEEFGLATADVSGPGWEGTSEIVQTSNPNWYAVGPLDPFEITLRCRPNGNCVNRDSGNPWRQTAPGVYTVTTETTGDCSNTATGQVTTPGGYHETAEYTWTVSEAVDGRATEFTEVGTIHGEVTAAGLADGCTFDGTPGGPVNGDATVEGTASRS